MLSYKTESVMKYELSNDEQYYCSNFMDQQV